MNLAVVMFASDTNDPRFKSVCRIVDSLGLRRFVTVGKWDGFCRKIINVQQMLPQLSTYSHILHIDAYDTIITGTEDEILDKFLSLNKPLVFGSEVNCWPDKDVATLYPATDSLWPYLNSGSYMGEREYMIEVLGKLAVRPEEDDQRVLTRFMLENPGAITLDTECVLFQTLIGSFHLLKMSYRSLYNTYTDTYPLIAHHNGGGNVNAGEVTKLWQE